MTKTHYKLTDKHNHLKSHYVFLQSGGIACGATNIMYRLNSYLQPRKNYILLSAEYLYFKCKFRDNIDNHNWRNHCVLPPAYFQERNGKVKKLSGREIKVYTKNNKRYIMCDKKKLYINRDDKYIYKPSIEGFETTVEDFEMI